MRCIISTPTNTQTLDNLISITIPTSKGQTQIKTGHAEYITNIVSGTLTYINKQGKETDISVQKGVCHVLQDVVKIVI